MVHLRLEADVLPAHPIAITAVFRVPEEPKNGVHANLPEELGGFERAQAR